MIARMSLFLAVTMVISLFGSVICINCVWIDDFYKCKYKVPAIDDAVDIGLHYVETNRQEDECTQPEIHLFNSDFADKNFMLNEAHVNNLCTIADPSALQALVKDQILNPNPATNGETYCQCINIGYKNGDERLSAMPEVVKQVLDTSFRTIRAAACEGVCNCCMMGTQIVGNAPGQCRSRTYDVPGIDDGGKLGMNVVNGNQQNKGFIQADLKVFAGYPDNKFVLNGGYMGATCAVAISSALAQRIKERTVLQGPRNNPSEKYCECRSIGYKNDLIAGPFNEVPDSTLVFIRAEACSNICNCCVRGNDSTCIQLTTLSTSTITTTSTTTTPTTTTTKTTTTTHPAMWPCYFTICPWGTMNG